MKKAKRFGSSFSGLNVPKLFQPKPGPSNVGQPARRGSLLVREGAIPALQQEQNPANDSSVTNELQPADSKQEDDVTLTSQLSASTIHADSTAPLVVPLERSSPCSVTQMGRNVNISNEDIHERESDSSEPQSKLGSVMKSFKQNYEQLAATHSLVLTSDTDMHAVLQIAEAEQDVRYAAQIFGKEIPKVLERTMEKHNPSNKNRIGLVTNFLAKLYPFVRLSLRLTNAIAEGVAFMPLKGAANGLEIILQIVDDENRRYDDFRNHLKEIEFQAARIAANPNFHAMSASGRNLMQEKGDNLMSAIIEFFDSALRYFSHSFVGNLGRSVVQGTDVYEVGKKMLQKAIDEYDQAVMDLTAMLVAGKLFISDTEIADLIEIQFTQKSLQSQKQDEEFLRWLSPSFELVEAQLRAVRNRRGKETLKWASTMSEFRAWHSNDYNSELYSGEGIHNSKSQMLWIRGAAGIGKSTMAGYLIDVVKVLYPDSLVLYFFCKAGDIGLTNARDIIRTLAYQCLENSKARSALEDLKRSGFQIEEKIGVRHLFAKLLQVPLSHTEKDIYIILDGLDEADNTSLDDVETRPQRRQLDILLECITHLSARTLFVSRPSSDIQTIASEITAKTIASTDNINDIRTYVQQTIDNSPKLQKQFQRAGINPVEYILQKANGVFLWVVLALEQLSEATTKSEFKDCLNQLSEASGDTVMEELYSNILLKVNFKDKKWLQKVLEWVVIARRPLTLEELKAAVEWSLNDEHDDFKRFLEVQCGSILHFLPCGTGTSTTVQLIHETFRTFLIHPNRCSGNFFIDQKSVNVEVVLHCLQYMISNKIQTYMFNNYAPIFWVRHLIETEASQQNLRANELLINLRHFFRSRGVTMWVKYGKSSWPVSNWPVRPVRHWYMKTVGSESYAKEPPLRAICAWLAEYRRSHLLTKTLDSMLNDEEEVELKNSIKWMDEVLRNEQCLGEIVGKSAASLWLYNVGDPCSEIEQNALLAIKSYRMQENCSLRNELTYTEVSRIEGWAGDNFQKCLMQKRNVGFALFSLKQWDDCISCLEGQDGDANDLEVLRSLGTAYKEMGDYDGAINAFKNSIEKDPTSSWVLQELSEIYKVMGDYDGAINVLKNSIEKNPTSSWVLQELSEIYKENGDYDGAIEIFEKAIEENPTELPWLWGRLGEAYKAKGDYDEAIEAFQKAIEQNPRASSLEWKNLWEAYGAKGDYDGAIESFKKAIEQNSTGSWWLWDILWDAYTTKEDYNSGIKAFRNAIEKDPTAPWSAWEKLGEAYKTKGDYDSAIKAFQKAIEKSPIGWRSLWNDLWEIYKVKGDYDSAIEMLQKAIEKDSAALWSLQSQWDMPGEAYKGNWDHKAIGVFQKEIEKDSMMSWMWDKLWEAYKIKGDYEGAIEAFQKAIDKNPMKSWLLWEKLWEVRKATGDYDGAIEAFQKTIEKDPNAPRSAWGKLWEAYKTKGDYDSAIETSQKAIEKDSSALWSLGPPWDMLGEAYKAKEDYDSAIEVFQTVIEKTQPISSHSVELWDKLWGAYKGKGDFDSAIKAFQNVIENDPMASPWFRDKLWEAYMAKGDYDGAIGAFQKTIEKNPTASRLEWDKLGEAYKAKGDYESAIKAFQTAIEKDPMASSWLWDKLWEVYKAKGDYDGAIGAFQEVIEKTSMVSWMWDKLWRAYKEKGDYEGAIDALQKEIDKNPMSSWPLWDGLGEACKVKGDYDSAIETFRKAIEKNPMASWRWNKLGQAYTANMDYDGAVKAYDSAIQRIPYDYSFYIRLGDLYLIKRDYDNAINVFNIACAKATKKSFLYAYLDFRPSSLENIGPPINEDLTKGFLWDLLGEAYKKKGDHTGANKVYDIGIKMYKDAITKQSNNLLWKYTGTVEFTYCENVFGIKSALSESTLWFALGEVYKARGDDQNALSAFQCALDLEKTNSWLENRIYVLRLTMNQ